MKNPLQEAFDIATSDHLAEFLKPLNRKGQSSIKTFRDVIVEMRRLRNIEEQYLMITNIQEQQENVNNERKKVVRLFRQNGILLTEGVKATDEISEAEVDHVFVTTYLKCDSEQEKSKFMKQLLNNHQLVEANVTGASKESNVTENKDDKKKLEEAEEKTIGAGFPRKIGSEK